MEKISSTAMVLAAGLGTRMRPLTLQKPKPLFEVGGRTMLDHALDKLVALGIRRAVVNCFYLADQIEARMSKRYDLEIIISRETELLDTGGGIKNALQYFDDKPFFALNADLPWIDGDVPSLSRMKDAWQADKMDCLLLLMETTKARGFGPDGNFSLSDDGHVTRINLPKPLPYVWISAQLLKPELFDAVDETSFSNNLIWDNAEKANRLFGLPHDGSCYHVGTPDDFEKANALLSSGQGWL